MSTRTAIVGFLLTILTACIVVPIPTPEWGDEPITRDQFDALENGIGSLSEDGVVALLGAPQRRYADGRVLIYEWVRNQGLWLIGVGNTGDISAGESEHRLCLLFETDGALKAIEHIDSALFSADSQVSTLLDEWLGDAAAAGEAPGFGRSINSEGFALTPHTGTETGVMLFAESQPRPPCWNEFNNLETAGYRFYAHEQLRDDFYPWLEPPWIRNLDTIRSSPDLASHRERSSLRFIIVVASGRNPMAGELCDGRHPSAIGCYEVSYLEQHGRIAVLDLGRFGEDGAEWVRIPEFPTTRREVCRALMAYALDDVQMQVSSDETDGDPEQLIP